MKYFIDTEFLEGTQKGWFGKTTKPTIDLISVGIVCEDGREYYAISKDFNLKEAWNRYDLKTDEDGRNTKVYWIRDNVLLPIYRERVHGDMRSHIPFTYTAMKGILKGFGKSNVEIARQIREFCLPTHGFVRDWYEELYGILGMEKEGFEVFHKYENTFDALYASYQKPEFYGYYSDYDWVVFCWLFGKMIDLPKGFPMFAFDIQQQIEEYNIDKKLLLENIPQINCHNSLQDAIWNFKAYQYIQNKIENEGKRST